MKILAENNCTYFDCDNTLVIWPEGPRVLRKGTKEFYYGNEKIHLFPHEPHIRFLKHCHLRGDHIVVWSQNGYAWAEQIVLALDLKDFVDEVRSKPTRHVDDTTKLEDIVGNRIFMSYNPEVK